MDAINAQTIAADRRRSGPQVRRRFDEVHRRLMDEMRALSPRAWSSLPPGAEMPRGEALGGILGGPDTSFAHVAAHLGDLEAYVRSR